MNGVEGCKKVREPTREVSRFKPTEREGRELDRMVLRNASACPALDS